MIKQQDDYISSSDFERLCKEGDVLCILAQTLADESMGSGYRLSYKNEFIRQRYVDLAKSFIKKLEKKNLIIIHENKNGDSNDSQN